ncbi:phosphoribosylanthranilate isomerase [Isoalcanivorax indicus]|uniref:phosphoribosylanthranilate isomerase n=1 Tax=Isoalcanivorax indicus TaxID=2202653 RepID=UPI000DBA2014|nr:phosphoribosylanthranilate isomerase [Isoalcanivorax indicus]
MFRTRTKICGITRPEDALSAAQAGADAVGLVFHPPSPRAVSAETAAGLCAVLPPFVTSVGLFVDWPAAQVQDLLARVPLDMLQFHGEETPDYCASFGRPWFKALAMRDGLDPAREAQRYAEAGARGILLDAWVPGLPGGTGATFDWGRIPASMPLPLILAGGLTPANVAVAVQQVQPWAVDVSGGVEAHDATGSACKGIKSATAINAFIEQVATAANARSSR